MARQDKGWDSLLEARTPGEAWNGELLFACSICVRLWPSLQPHSPPCPQPQALSEAPLFAEWSGKSHPDLLVNHPGVTHSGCGPWKEMAAFFHCLGTGRGARSRGEGAGAAVNKVSSDGKAGSGPRLQWDGQGGRA